VSTHLIIPDAHAMPGTTTDRFHAVGELIMRERPDVIICLGDFADMPSLCSYDKGRKSFEGRRYTNDVQSTLAAQEALFRSMNAYNLQQTRNKKSHYKPRMIMTLGNHEHRINRAIELEPSVLEGTISVEDLGYTAFGWEVHPFLRTVEVDGVFYSHYFPSGTMGGPILGALPARGIITKHMASCSGGHDHRLDHCIATAPDGKRVRGLVAGCLIDFPMDFAHHTQHMWWSGVTIKRHVHNGDYDPEFISLHNLMR
jgi:hypothetical protein